jgi:hypothetical protein
MKKVLELLVCLLHPVAVILIWIDLATRREIGGVAKLAWALFSLIPIVPFLYVLTGGDLWWGRRATVAMRRQAGHGYWSLTRWRALRRWFGDTAAYSPAVPGAERGKSGPVRGAQPGVPRMLTACLADSITTSPTLNAGRRRSTLSAASMNRICIFWATAARVLSLVFSALVYAV